MYNILVIEDNDTMREGMVQILEKMRLTVTEAKNGQSGLESFARGKHALVVTDYRMSGLNGLEVLQRIKQLSPNTELMIITAYGSIDLAVQAMQQGAADFIAKPFSHDEFRLKIEKILQKMAQDEQLNRLAEENVYLRQEIDDRFNFGEIIGESPKMKELYSTIAKVAKTDSSVIIYGESGTGKELVARAIHRASARAGSAFIRVNCGALAEGVLESELFGHEKGAFTGAVRRKRGRFELADGGTIFLDEIGDLPATTQVKLLRFAGARIRTGRRRADTYRGCTRFDGDKPGSQEIGVGREIPRRFVLPAAYHSDLSAAAARAQRGYYGVSDAFLGTNWQRDRACRNGSDRGRNAPIVRLSLARQYS